MSKVQPRSDQKNHVALDALSNSERIPRKLHQQVHGFGARSLAAALVSKDL